VVHGSHVACFPGCLMLRTDNQASRGNIMVKSLIRVSGVVVAVVAACTVAGSASVSAQAQRRAQPAHEFWLVITPGESFSEAARNAALTSGGGQVTATIEEMLKKVEAGQAVYVPQGTRDSVTSVRATIAQLKSALSASGSLYSRRVQVRHAAAMSHIMLDPPISGNGCGTINKGGVKVDPTWCNLKLAIDGDDCDPVCEDVDNLRANVTTNPGALVSSSPYTVTNVVSTGYSSVFTDVHINWNTLCYSNGQECGHGTTGNINPNSSDVMNPTSDSGMWTYRISHSYYLWALFIPNGGSYSSAALTGTATCEAESQGNQCFYPTG
jgi:hypothetical protein